MTEINEAFFIGLIVRETEHRFANSGIVGSVSPEWIVKTYEDISEQLKFQLTDINRNILMNQIRAKIDIPLEGAGAVSIVDNDDFQDWFDEKLLGKYWERFEKYLEDRGNISKPVRLMLDSDTNKILSRMANPKSEKSFNCRGMVVGDVQAGKTLNYSALLNKACDVGYHVLIVLTGMTEDLRWQTQLRLDKDFVGQKSRVGNQQTLDSARRVGVGHINWQIKPICLTDVETDFKNKRVFHIDSVNEPILIVAKKNPTVLNEINSWINSQKKDAKDKVQKAFLIIDDEADNASVNTGKQNEDPKVINHAIRRILDSCARVTYVGYTATPFANIFISPDDSYDASDIKELFPKDFIFTLVPPPNYCGGRFFFLDDTFERAIEDISDAEKYFPSGKNKDKPINELPNSLIQAIEQYFVTIAIKDFRRTTGEIPTLGDNRFDSMLINISTLKNVQNTIKPLVMDEVDKISRAISSTNLLVSKNDPIVNSLNKTFEEKFKPHLDSEITWIDVAKHLVLMEQVRVISINGDSDDVLEWEENSPKNNIAIGGLTLSRGLTLNGLTISYLFRNSTMYDTIMQMGRWFGYRDGYQDLIRLWCSSSTMNAFQKATKATEELREDIRQMNKLSMKPREFGMKVAAYPGLLPTAKNKMQLGIGIDHSVSFADKKRETYFFNTNTDLENFNSQLVLNFTKNIVNLCAPSRVGKSSGAKGHLAFIGVSSELVIPLLIDYKYHQGNKDLPEKYFKDYLQELKLTELSKWNIIFYSRQSTSIKAGISEKLTDILKDDINSQERSIFLRKWLSEGDATCIPLSANMQLSTGDVDKLAPNPKEPTLIIHSIKITKYLPEERNVPSHLQGLIGRELFGITILFPNFTEKSIIRVFATPDYVKRYFLDQGLEVD